MSITQDATITTDTAAQLRAIVEELSARFFERGEVAELLMTTMLAGQHALILGPPGTAKSELARDLSSRITSARYYETLLTKFTDPKSVFGPVDVAALTRGEYRQVLEGHATQAHFLFLDEIFKCSSAALNALLSLLNERLYHSEAGGGVIKCDLISCISASNELPDGEELAAIFDRLLVRVEVAYLAEDANFAALLESAVVRRGGDHRTTVDLVDFQLAVDVDVPAIGLPTGVVTTISKLRAELLRAGIAASDRRWRQAIRLLQAAAYLDGRDAVDEDDLAVLAHVLWASPSERPTVERLVLAAGNPTTKVVKEVEELFADLDATFAKLLPGSRATLSEWAIKEAKPKLTRASTQLARLRKAAVTDGRSTVRIDKVIRTHRALQSKLYTEALGFDPTQS